MDDLLTTMLQRTLAGQDGHAYPTDRWDKTAGTSLKGDRIALTEVDAKPFLDAGLLFYQSSGTLYYRLTAAGIRQALPHVQYKPLDVEALMAWVGERVLFGPSAAIGGETAIPLLYTPGGSRLVLVLGDNAGGKSLFRRVIQQATHRGQKGGFGEPEIPRGKFPVREFIGLSMQTRTRGGVVSSMLYGDESYHSTGELSARTTEMGIKTVSEREHTTILYWDEPDIGMSGGAAAGAGITIREFVAQGMAPLCEAVFVTSHSPALVRQLAPLNPHYVFVGDANGPKDLDAWFKYQENPTPILPEDLAAMSLKRFLQVRDVLNAKGGK